MSATPVVRDYIASLIRTIVPVAVGLVVHRLAAVGVDVDPGALSTVLVGVLVGGYYAAVRALEARWPWLGWLLGLPRTPTYQQAAAPSAVQTELEATSNPDPPPPSRHAVSVFDDPSTGWWAACSCGDSSPRSWPDRSGAADWAIQHQKGVT